MTGSKSKVFHNKNKEYAIKSAYRKLLASYDKDDVPKYLKPERNKSESKSDSPHISEYVKLSGNIVKGIHSISDKQKISMNYYAWNAWNYLGSEEAPEVRRIYRDRTVWRKGEHKVPGEEFEFFNSGVPMNFNGVYSCKKIDVVEAKKAEGTADQMIRNCEESERSNLVLRKDFHKRLKERATSSANYVAQKFPYPWQAHHILPMEAFTGHFTTEELEYILRSEYDINCGENVIFLPSRKRFMELHWLPGHWSSHAKYSKTVKKRMIKVKKRIGKEVSEGKPCKEISAGVETDLHQIEESMFELLSILGPSKLG